MKKTYKNDKQQSNDNLKGGDVDFNISDAIQAQPLEVKVHGDNFDRALRTFRALVQKERILSIYKEKQVYEKPSVKRRRKKNESARKLIENYYKSKKDDQDRERKHLRRLPDKASSDSLE